MQIAGSDIEGQVDRLLVERMNVDPSFAEWFWNVVSSQRRRLSPFQEAKAQRNYPRRFAGGQTDIGLTSLPNRVAILIENKVIHKLSMDQCLRYQKERDGLISIGWSASIVLTAPKRFLEKTRALINNFDACISYESIDEKLGGSTLLCKAIERCERGYIAEGMPSVTTNFEGYAELIRRGFPKLTLITPIGNNPTQSRTAKFDVPKNVPNGVPIVHLIHQWQQGSAKILFWGWGKHRSILEPIINSDVSSYGFLVEPNSGKSLAFMRATPIIDNRADFHTNLERLTDGLEVIEELHDWYMRNIPIVSKWIGLTSTSLS